MMMKKKKRNVYLHAFYLTK